MESNNLELVVLEILEVGFSKSTAQIVEEFRIEFLHEWRKLEIEGEMLYGNSCSSLQQPYARISQVLKNMPETKCSRHVKGNQYFWSKSDHWVKSDPETEPK